MVPKLKKKWLKAPLSLNRKTTQCENHGRSVYSQCESKSCLCEWARRPGLRFPALPERVELMSMFALSCDCLPCVSQNSAMSKKKTPKFNPKCACVSLSLCLQFKKTAWLMRKSVCVCQGQMHLAGGAREWTCPITKVYQAQRRGREERGRGSRSLAPLSHGCPSQLKWIS